MNNDIVRIQLEPVSAVVEVPRYASLMSALSQHGVEFPCGGTGICGGCRVHMLAGSLPVTEPDVLVFSPHEIADGWRLACQARAEMPLVLECSQWQMDVLSDDSRLTGTGKSGLGIAIDLGTTTIAAQMIDMATGAVLAVETGLNPQASFGSDVMSRIQAALSGSDLTTVIRLELQQIIRKLAGSRAQEIVDVILVGNTVMHHLFSELDVEPLAHVPFESPHLGVRRFQPRELGWPLSRDCGIRFERCLGGFVGSDILAGMIAVGIPSASNVRALIDLGTNGEIAIGNRDGIICTSAAAGPAFEAGSIRMGMRAAAGAISRVSLCHNEIHVSVIGDVDARGICGSGLVDAVAVGVESGKILPSGRIAGQTKLIPLKDPVALYQSDVRELQLAKGAIASGFRLLLRRRGTGANSLENIFLAGAFGNYVQIESAIRIGLIEAPRTLISAAGNTALRGAKILLLSAQELSIPRIEHVCLAAEPDFQEEFTDCMTFPEVDWRAVMTAADRKTVELIR